MSARACFITWTTYGSWLHGADKPSVDDRETRFGAPMMPTRTPLAAWERSRMIGEPFVMDEPLRRCVHATIIEHARLRSWALHALNVRTNHVHVVVTPDRSPERVMNELKSWATRRLREQGLIAPNARVWTTHGSTRHLFTDEAFNGAVHYVLHQQGPDLV